MTSVLTKRRPAAGTAPESPAPLPPYGLGPGAVHRAQAVMQAGNRTLDEVEGALSRARLLLLEGLAGRALRLEQLEEAIQAIGRLEADLINLGAEMDAERASLASAVAPDRELPARFRP